MTVYSRILDCVMNIVSGAGQLTIPVEIAFDNAGTAVNTATNVYIAGPNLVSALLLNSAIRSLVAAYVNTTYGTSISATDVVIVSGAIAAPVV